ncbi:FtsQ-type POTRA domain-containing protein [Corynebacterium sp. ES2775-CONJ]|nr:FtsQ-type POTRA domain-containing protein [Corynebacterium sp. ES2775-CONJ]
MAKKISLTLVGIGSICLILFAIAFFFPVFTVKEIISQGSQHTHAEDIQNVTDPLIGTNTVRVDTQDIAQDLVALPWVLTATVKTQLPSTVAIEIVEHEPVMYEAKEDGDHLIDRQGRVFVVEPHPEGLIAVTGVTDDQGYRDILGVIESIGVAERSAIAEIQAPSASSMALLLKDGKRVFWGSNENSHDKAIALSVAVTRPEQTIDISGAPIVSVVP